MKVRKQYEKGGEVKVRSGAGFILEVGRVNAWRVNRRGTNTCKGGRELITIYRAPFPEGESLTHTLL